MEHRGCLPSALLQILGSQASCVKVIGRDRGLESGVSIATCCQCIICSHYIGQCALGHMVRCTTQPDAEIATYCLFLLPTITSPIIVIISSAAAGVSAITISP